MRAQNALASVALLMLASTAACGTETEADDGLPAGSIAIKSYAPTETDPGFELPKSGENLAQADYSAMPATLTLITWGSSTCPEYPTSVTWSKPTTLVIATSTDYGDAACTMDLVPNAMVVEIPPSQDHNRVEAVILNGEEIELNEVAE